MNERDIKTLKAKVSSIDMNKRDLKKLTKSQLIKLLLKQEKDRQAQKPITPPRTGKWESVKPKPVPRKSVNEYEDPILPPSPQFRDGYKPIPKQKTDRPPKPKRQPHPPPPPPPPPADPFNFDDDIFQTENQSLEKFKIVSVQSRQNKQFKSFTNKFKVKILKKLDDVKEIYHIFQELIKTVKRRRKLSNNGMLRFVIQNEELADAILTKFNKVQDFKQGDLEQVIRILEYRDITLEKCKIVVQSVKIPAGKGTLYLTKDTVSRKNCIITVKNDDTICLARAIVTAYENIKKEMWSNTQIHEGFNKSRKLQRNKHLSYLKKLM